MTDLHMAGDRLGPGRLAHAYAWRRFIDLGQLPINGSDAPVESPNPFWGLYAAVARRDLDWRPEDGFQTGDALTLDEAVRSYTVWAARAAFQEGQIGCLAPGARCDMAVLDRDPYDTPVRELHAIKPVMTVIGGSPAWTEPRF
jgi:predicted amidohydrolase YtcJ